MEKNKYVVCSLEYTMILKVFVISTHMRPKSSAQGSDSTMDLVLFHTSETTTTHRPKLEKKAINRRRED